MLILYLCARGIDVASYICMLWVSMLVMYLCVGVSMLVMYLCVRGIHVGHVFVCYGYRCW
jgi:hypothetical protein